MSDWPGHITSSEVLKRTGLTSAKTLTRWHQMGLIPAPVIRTAPSGRGKTAFFDDRVVRRITRVRDLVGQGYGLRAAAAEVDRQDLEHAVVDTIRSRDGSERRRSDVFISYVLAHIERLIPLATPLGQQLLVKLQEGRAYEEALLLAQQGINPVLVFDGNDLRAVPDFLIRFRAGFAKNIPTFRQPVLMIPLALPLEEAGVAVGDQRAFDYNICADDTVIQVVGGRSVRRQIDLVPPDPWGWRFSDSKAARVTKQGRARKQRVKKR